MSLIKQLIFRFEDIGESGGESEAANQSSTDHSRKNRLITNEFYYSS